MIAGAILDFDFGELSRAECGFWIENADNSSCNPKSAIQNPKSASPAIVETQNVFRRTLVC